VVSRARPCEQCGAQLPRSQVTGRRRDFCSDACRQANYRARGGRASGTTGAERARQAKAKAATDNEAPSPTPQHN
jgi:hypothetical protein